MAGAVTQLTAPVTFFDKSTIFVPKIQFFHQFLIHKLKFIHTFAQTKAQSAYTNT